MAEYLSPRPARRWKRSGERPLNHFATTPTVAWVEWIRHQEITDSRDLEGVAPRPLPYLCSRCWTRVLPGWCCVPEGRPGPELLYLVRREGLLAVAARSKSLTGTGPTPMRGQTRILVTSVRRGRDTAGIPV